MVTTNCSSNAGRSHKAKGTVRDPVGGNIVKSKVLATAAVFCMLCCSTATAQWPLNTYGVQNDWEVEIGTRILDRPTDTDVQNLNLITTAPTNVTVFTGRDATDLDASAGADFRFLRKTNYDYSWEVRGFFNMWDNFETRSGNLRSPLFTPPTLPLFSRPDRFDYAYDSELFSLEVLYKKAVHPGFNLLLGPRYVDLGETVTIDSNFINPFINGFAFDYDVLTRTDNHMPGFLLGLEIRRPLIRDVFFSGGIKGTLLANNASTSTVSTGTIVGGNPIVTTLYEDSRSFAAGLYELSARFHYDISPGVVSCYLGYEAFWMDSVAIAPTQLVEAFNPPSQLNNNNTSFVHGLAVGLMIRTGGAGSRAHYRDYGAPHH